MKRRKLFNHTSVEGERGFLACLFNKWNQEPF